MRVVAAFVRSAPPRPRGLRRGGGRIAAPCARSGRGPRRRRPRLRHRPRPLHRQSARRGSSSDKRWRRLRGAAPGRRVRLVSTSNSMPGECHDASAARRPGRRLHPPHVETARSRHGSRPGRGYPRARAALDRPAVAPLRPAPRRTVRGRRRRGRSRVARRAAGRRGRPARLLRSAWPSRTAARAPERLQAGRPRGARTPLPRGARRARPRSPCASSPPTEIDGHGLHRSNLRGLRAVLTDLHPPAEACLVDGFRLGPLAPPHPPLSTATRRARRSRPPRSSRR